MRGFSLAVLTALICVFSTSSAYAAKLPIPFFERESLTRVLDLPDTADFQRDDGQYVDLGYKHVMWGEGEWIGYLDGERYLELTNEQALMIAMSAGRMELPAVPPKPASVWMTEILTPFGLLLIALGFLKKIGLFGSRVSPREEAAIDRRLADAAREVEMAREQPAFNGGNYSRSGATQNDFANAAPSYRNESAYTSHQQPISAAQNAERYRLGERRVFGRR